MELTIEERNMLAGAQGQATRKAMEILVALGKIYGAERMVPVASVQIAGVSYDNLGEAGLQFLEEMAAGGESRRSRDGRVRVLTTLNPAGMDVENWESLGISPDFAANQRRVLEAFARMGVVTTCTCTPYLAGNLPGFGEHLAWAESSAVCYANSVIGARTNREGGPSALAAALTGRTPAYGFHLDSQRLPSLAIDVTADLEATGQWGATLAFGALGWAIGKHLEAAGKRRVVYIRGVRHASLEALKAFCASLATYGGAALFHMEGITPESGSWPIPPESLPVRDADLEEALAALSDASAAEVDFVSLGCPHLTLREIARIAELLAGQRVKKEFWITTSRPVKGIADQMGYTRIIEASGAKFATDTCCVVAPIQGRFKALATDSAKACYYAYAKNGFKTRFLPFDQVVSEAVK
jgi:predicted aconitase